MLKSVEQEKDVGDKVGRPRCGLISVDLVLGCVDSRLIVNIDSFALVIVWVDFVNLNLSNRIPDPRHDEWNFAHL
jgi:hypothetical protein